MKNSLILLCITLFMIGCASTSGTKNRLANADVSDHSKIVLADKNSEEKVICKQIKRTGSHRTTTVCRSQTEIENTRTATQRDLRGTQHQSGATAANETGR